MDYKKNAYWLGLAGVVVVILIVYMVIVPPVEALADTAKGDCVAQIATIKEKAAHATEPNVIKTDAHVKMAEEFNSTVNKQILSILSEMSNWKVRSAYTDKASMPDREFDAWLSTKRTDLAKMMGEAGIAPFDTFNKDLLFDGNTTDVKADDVTKRPKYRVWKVTLVEEIVKTLCTKPANIEVIDFGKEDLELKSPVSRQVPCGVSAIKELTVVDAKNAMTRKESLEGAQKEIFDRLKGRGGAGTTTPSKPVDMPITYSSVDMQFVAPLSAVPKLLKALESTETYHAVITRVDFARDAQPYPKLADSAERGPNPIANTFFREAPVRVLVSFDIYEFDEAKAAALKKAVGLEK